MEMTASWQDKGVEYHTWAENLDMITWREKS